mmetsp:Transcript_104772/g.312998  ORF Transcript_104772/g.312998 Transcript_104772/m.312998 type:complete len:221 (-) Transcript_104772:756-1418(-)
MHVAEPLQLRPQTAHLALGSGGPALGRLAPRLQRLVLLGQSGDRLLQLSHLRLCSCSFLLSDLCSVWDGGLQGLTQAGDLVCQHLLALLQFGNSLLMCHALLPLSLEVRAHLRQRLPGLLESRSELPVLPELVLQLRLDVLHLPRQQLRRQGVPGGRHHGGLCWWSTDRHALCSALGLETALLGLLPDLEGPLGFDLVGSRQGVSPRGGFNRARHCGFQA